MSIAKRPSWRRCSSVRPPEHEVNATLSVISGLLLAIAIALALPVGVLLAQIAVAVRRRADDATADGALAERPHLAVLMPAHNEAAGIVRAIAQLRPQLRAADRLLVVADNCSDETARVASAAGAEVVERRDPQRRGKGYALDFGVRHLEASPPDIVVIVDADCDVEAGSLDRLARQCAASGHPVQALYLMRSPADAGLKQRMAQFAWVVKNHARPLGLHRLGLPCQLMGTGMAFPWMLIRAAPLASGHIVEDMQLGLDLARAGSAPQFCPQARVTSVFPNSEEGASAQRTRWEHGHLAVIATQGPRTLWRALVSANAALAAMALDLAVPPLASLVMLLVAGAILSAILAVLGGSALPLLVLAAALAALSAAVGLAWWRFGRDIVSFIELATAPVYVLRKLPIYARLWRARQVDWVRTKRDDGSH
jgi:cellulose synthase/poly-beta-1,6-N-acetylglucosamine synthase-like glycosyltransferase